MPAILTAVTAEAQHNRHSVTLASGRRITPRFVRAAPPGYTAPQWAAQTAAEAVALAEQVCKVGPTAHAHLVTLR